MVYFIFIFPVVCWRNTHLNSSSRILQMMEVGLNSSNIWLYKYTSWNFFWGKIGFIASKDHRFWKIPSKDLCYIKYHWKNHSVSKNTIPLTFAMNRSPFFLLDKLKYLFYPHLLPLLFLLPSTSTYPPAPANLPGSARRSAHPCPRHAPSACARHS